jgi:predicted amidohydrolase YtcJ
VAEVKTTVLIASAIVALAAAGGQVQPADLIVVNAKVVTVDRAFSIAQAVAVRDGRITAVGSDRDIRAQAGPRTRVIDASGRTVIPGIIETHVHGAMVAPAEAVQPFPSLDSIAALQEWVRAEARRAPAGTWIWGPRTFPTRLREHRFPTRSELDAAAPNHPVVIDGAYALILNSAALRAAGITAATPDPPGGAIVKGADGQPTGLLRNVGAMLARFRPKEATEIPLDQLERLHRVYNRAGITSVIERGATLDGYRAYEALKRANRLHVRSTVTIRIPVDQIANAESYIGSLPVKFRAGDEWLKAGPLKITVDGGILIGTSYMRKPFGLDARQLYAVDDPAYHGFLTLTPQQIATAFLAGHKLGWQMVAHVTGDAGVDVVLDAIEAAQKAHKAADRRHTLIHAYFPDRETARRAARLNVLVDTQPVLYFKDADALAEALGRSRLEHFMGLRTWLDAGVRTTINSDHMFGLDRDKALNPFNPFLTMYVATARKTEGGQTIGAGEAVTREQALRMMTSDAAYFTFDEANRGSIEAGKLGDLVVLSDDLMTVPDERMRQIQPEITIIGGRVVYERSAQTTQTAPVTQPAPATAAAPLRIGLIGIDSSHAGTFTQLLNDPSRPDHVPGARVVVAFKGGSPDVEASANRIEKFTAELRDTWKIEFVDSIDELLRRVDAVMINSVDGRVHLAQARKVLAAHKPLFIDKPMTASVRDGIELARIARETGTPVFSSSSLRFHDEVQAIKKDPRFEEILGAITWGPATLEPHHPDLFWYGIHAVEMLYTFMGPGCERVTRTNTPGADVVVGYWKDGRIGVVRGIRDGASTYGQVVYGRKAIANGPPAAAETGVKRSTYAGLITEVVKFFRTGKSPVPIDETLEILAFMEAADVSKTRGGAPVPLSYVFSGKL